MRQFGFRCMLARDLTEAMTGYAEESFNPTQGTLEVIELIERDLVPSITWRRPCAPPFMGTRGPRLCARHSLGTPFWRGSLPHPYPGGIDLPPCSRSQIRYTLDGTDPTVASPVYRKPVPIEDTATLKAAGFRGGKPVTRISEARYWKYPPVPDPPDVFLSDMEPAGETAGAIVPHSYAIPQKPKYNRSVNGEVLSNRDNKYFKGIGVQSPYELVFRLKPEYKRFVALAGVDDECMRWDAPDNLPRWPQWSRPVHGTTSFRISQLVFQVRIDGRPVSETPPLFNGERAWGIDVKIPEGSREITLSVKDVESRLTDPHGHADWLNAGFWLA